MSEHSVDTRFQASVTIVTQRPGCKEIPWVRFLLGDLAGDLVEDPDRTVVVPQSLVLCDWLERLTPSFLDRVSATGSVGLFHISDEWYRAKLGAYDAFAFVWRNHFHSGLRGSGVLQLPLGPVALDPVVADPSPAALRPPRDRSYAWSWAGNLKTTRFAMLKAFRRIDNGFEHRTRTHDERFDNAAYLELLADSVFAPCGMGHVNLESFRVYEALEMGAIPIVEERPWLDYFGALLGDHPLPSVRSWRQAVPLVRRLLDDEAELFELHETCVSWWSAHKRELAAIAQDTVTQAWDENHHALRARGAARLRGRLEILRHKHPTGLVRRGQLVAGRLVKHGSLRQASRS